MLVGVVTGHEVAMTKGTVGKTTSVFSKGEQGSYAGKHLLVELWQGTGWTSLATVERVLREAVTACGATLLEVRLHRFSPYEGISGVAIVQESHLSIHTWPEFEYAAVDIFLCGNADPYKAVDALKAGFQPKRVELLEIKRGLFDTPGTGLVSEENPKQVSDQVAP